MAPFQIILKHSPDLNEHRFMWSRVKHGYQGRRVHVTLLSYHIRWKDGTNQQYPQCPLRVDFSSPPDEPEKIQTVMFGVNGGQSGGEPDWNNTRYNNSQMGFFIPNGEHGGDQHPGFTSLSFAPMRWVANLLDNDVYCSVTLDTNVPWQSTKPDAPGEDCPDITDNILYIILNFDITLVQ